MTLGSSYAETSNRTSKSAAPKNDRVPWAAATLGASGAVPFVVLAIAGLLLEDTARGYSIDGLATYGAVILSFLAGVHWGLAIARYGTPDSQPIGGRLVLSVVPSLIAWAALFLPAPAGLFTLSTAFLMMFFVDRHLAGRRYAPAWYPTLRAPLTVVVVASLVVGAVV